LREKKKENSYMRFDGVGGNRQNRLQEKMLLSNELGNQGRRKVPLARGKKYLRDRGIAEGERDDANVNRSRGGAGDNKRRY